MYMKHEIYYATSNEGKFEEVKSYLSRFDASIDLKQFQVEIEEIQTLDQKAISIDKAHKAWMILKKQLLVDDGGIYFEGFNQFPGTLSKHVFEGIGYEGIFKLVEENHKAFFKMHMAY